MDDDWTVAMQVCNASYDAFPLHMYISVDALYLYTSLTKFVRSAKIMLLPFSLKNRPASPLVYHFNSSINVGIS